MEKGEMLGFLLYQIIQYKLLLHQYDMINYSLSMFIQHISNISGLF